MNRPAPVVRTAFLAALRHGPAEFPIRARVALDSCEAWSASRFAEQLEDLGQELVSEFDFINLIDHRPLDDISQSRWILALRGTLKEIQLWSQSEHGSQHRLRILLTVLCALGFNTSSIRQVAGELKPWLHETSLARLIASTNIGVWRRSNSDDIRLALDRAAALNDFENISYLQHDVMPEWHPDAAVAISLLFEIDSASCARAISEAPSVLTGMLALQVLGNDSLDLAVLVKSPVFKLLCVQAAQEGPREPPSLGNMQRVEELIVQMSQTELWEPWVRALRLPTTRPTIDLAAGRALAKMDTSAWRAFVSQLPLTHSNRNADPMAVLMQEFERHAGPERAQDMWQIAFDQWNAWDYGLSETQMHYIAPVATALDFAVAKYYSVVDSKLLEQEEAKLLQRITNIECEWFESLSALITKRNALIARLHLLRRGRDWSTRNAPEPPASAPLPANAYLVIRYRADAPTP